MTLLGRIKPLYLLAWLVLMFCGTASAQQKTVSGKIVADNDFIIAVIDEDLREVDIVGSWGGDYTSSPTRPYSFSFNISPSREQLENCMVVFVTWGRHPGVGSPAQGMIGYIESDKRVDTGYGAFRAARSEFQINYEDDEGRPSNSNVVKEILESSGNTEKHHVFNEREAAAIWQDFNTALVTKDPNAAPKWISRAQQIRDTKYSIYALECLKIIELPDRPPVWSPVPARVKSGQSVIVEPLNFTSDPDGDPITLVRVNPSTSNDISARIISGNRIQITSNGPVGNKSLSYIFTDQKRQYSGQIKIVVWKDSPAPVNEPPVTTHNSYSILVGNTVTVDPLSDDKDPEGIPLILQTISRPPDGISVRPNGKNLEITGNKAGQYTFSIEVSDTQQSSPSTITVNVENESSTSTPWWIWPLGGVSLLGAGILGFLKFGRGATPGPSPLAKPGAGGRLTRPQMSFRRKDDGVPFGKSPLIASVTEPGPPPREPASHAIPPGLPTISGPYAVLGEAYRATGRIGFAQEGIPTNDDVALGTGFLIAPNLIMTNQHVYEFYKQYLEGPECGGIEFIAERDRDASDFYEFDGAPPTIISDLDIAIFRLKKNVKGRTPIDRIHVPTDDLDKREVIVVGYPCPFEVDDFILSLVEPDPIFAVKRVTQGFVFRHSTDTDLPFGIFFKVDAAINSAAKMKAVCHNATTLPGNSGSPVLCAATGKLLGVHFAGSRSLFGKEAANLAMEIELIIAREKAKES